jgi:choline/ethanolamine kinase
MADYERVPAHQFDLKGYPSLAERTRFCAAYLAVADPDFAALTDAGERARRVHRLAREANALALASHLLWSLWGLIQASQSTIDFDYLEYSAQRLQQYFAHRDRTLAALDAPLPDHLPAGVDPLPRPRRRTRRST